jgi:hypothetical protein
MPLEEKPANPVPTTYVPLGIPHPVKTGESWVSIAKVHGIDPWDLIDFNFPGMKQIKQIDFRRATRHVNSYLREYRDNNSAALAWLISFCWRRIRSCTLQGFCSRKFGCFPLAKDKRYGKLTLAEPNGSCRQTGGGLRPS